MQMDQPQPMNLPMDAHRRSGAFPPEPAQNEMGARNVPAAVTASRLG